MSERLAILDTNVFGVAANLGSPLWVSLRRLCVTAGITMCIPEVVLREAVNLRRTEYQEAANTFRDANKSIGRFYELPGVYIPDVDEVVERWEADLRAHFRILEPDPEDAVEALTREASRIPPARDGRGARDSLIWLTCRRIAAAGHEVYFVSRNTKDFGKGPGNALHPELAAEVLGLSGGLTYLTSLDDVVDLVATRVDSPEFSDADALVPLIGFDLFDVGHDVIEQRGGISAAFDTLELHISDVRTLRAYKVDQRGLALIDGRAQVSPLAGAAAPAELRFMAWLEFGLDNREPLEAEVESITVVEEA